MPGGHPVQTEAPTPATSGNGDTGGDDTGGGGVDGAVVGQSESNQLQLPPALTQAPSEDAVGPPVWHDPSEAREHQPQFEDCVHALVCGGRGCYGVRARS